MSTKQLDFISVGPFKTGTSWIYDYLVDYQQIALPTKVKETFFFDKKFERGFDWYYSHFTQIDDQRKVGEIAPSYFHSLEAPQRIYQHSPQSKIVVTLREPVSRLVSFYLHMKQRGEIKPGTSFLEALSQKETLYNTARYYFHLSRWIDIFGADNVKVIFFKELKKSPINFAKQLCEQLELELENTSEDLSKKVNASQVPVNHTLSRMVYQSVKLMHNLGLHQIVKYGKNLGLKQLIYKKNKTKFEITNSEFAAAFELLKQDIMMLETELNFDLSDWKKIWLEKGVKVN